MDYFADISKFGTKESIWGPKISTVTNKWIKKDDDYFEDDRKQFESMGLDLDGCIANIGIEGMDELDKQEKVDIVIDAMTGEGISPNEEDDKTGKGGASACSAVTSSTTINLDARGTEQLNARQ